ncbi:MAG: hypothetical protein R3Y09_08555 [Clostridia bacterium]
MGAKEFLLRLMITLEPMVICIIAVVAVTCVFLPILIIKSRGLWVNSKNFRFLSLFYHLRFYDAIRLGSAFVKLILMMVFIIQFKALEEIHYICFIFVSILYAFDVKALFRTIANVFWCTLQIVAIFSLNIICSYILQINAKPEFLIVYIVLGIFVVLFAIYSFITEINEVSMGRRAKFEVNIK